jgi:hypothetical protein
LNFATKAKFVVDHRAIGISQLFLNFSSQSMMEKIPDKAKIEPTGRAAS